MARTPGGTPRGSSLPSFVRTGPEERRFLKSRFDINATVPDWTEHSDGRVIFGREGADEKLTLNRKVQIPPTSITPWYLMFPLAKTSCYNPFDLGKMEGSNRGSIVLIDRQLKQSFVELFPLSVLRTFLNEKYPTTWRFRSGSLDRLFWRKRGQASWVPVFVHFFPLSDKRANSLIHQQLGICKVIGLAREYVDS